MNKIFGKYLILVVLISTAYLYFGLSAPLDYKLIGANQWYVLLEVLQLGITFFAACLFIFTCIIFTNEDKTFDSTHADIYNLLQEDVLHPLFYLWYVVLFAVSFQFSLYLISISYVIIGSTLFLTSRLHKSIIKKTQIVQLTKAAQK